MSETATGQELDSATISTESATPEGEQGGEDLLARVEDLHLHFETERGVVKALDGVNFDIRQGEIFSLVGETGCGKTVTARSFVQLVPTPPGRYPQGSIRMRTDEECPECDATGCEVCYGTGRAFENLLAASTERMDQIRGDRIAMIFQDPGQALNPSLTVRKQMAESILAHQGEDVLREAGIDIDQAGALSRSVLREKASANDSYIHAILAKIPPFRKQAKEINRIVRERSVNLFNECQIAKPREILDAYPHELSGGQQQRVMIAMALASKPDLLIADEATTALDVTTQARILELINDLQSQYNTGVLYITHDLELVREIGDRVGVMYAGQMAEVGDVEDVYNDPLHPYTQGLIRSIPSERRVGKKLEGIEGSVPDLISPPDGCRFCTRCPEVMDECHDVDPELREEKAEHRVACHLYT